MKALKKLALVSAVSMISAGAFAMEAMDDESMAAATGQDGITILISPGTITTAAATGTYGVSAGQVSALDAGGIAGTLKGLTISQIVVHDDDGIATRGDSGALVIGDGTAADSTAVLADDTSAIQVLIDMVGNANGDATADDPMLNVAITTPDLLIKTGDIYVANSNAVADEVAVGRDTNSDGDATDAEVNGSTHNNRVRILNGLEIKMGGSTTTIQLGNEAQGAMIVANSTLVGGLTINNFELFDANSGGSIQASSLSMTNAGGANLTVNARVDAFGAAAPLGEGLYVTISQFGDAVNGADLALNNVAIGATGTTNIIGDVQILGLNVSGTTMVIRGH
ncbi:DUF6160 family protein [Agitococcus lubricus]|uniref:DUF6160 domain-containing protein n=1 Tax=Agitococcus lubricus TaxID=1077255 RepID=A0A2T5IZV1_9GAMM|nr:DUF6160 family protein [Agitococcus lubricus]PTQ89587.1 hypothetical protein C8N29_106118 [Agitococcus lubricus]